MSYIKPYADWLIELDNIRHKSNNDDGYSTRELAEIWKCSEKLARKRISVGMQKGLFTLGKKNIKRIDGIITPITVYCYKKKRCEKQISSN